MHVLLMEAARAAGFEPRMSGRAHDHTVRASWIGAGIGIGLVPQLVTPSLGTDLAIVELSDPIAREVSAVTLADGRSITATAFLRLLHRMTDATGGNGRDAQLLLAGDHAAK
jgi:DNA-binding transcriptional LysR family regulator